MKTYLSSLLLPYSRTALALLILAIFFILGRAENHAVVPLPGLVGHWQFEEGSGLTLADSSGNGLNGTLVSGPVWVPSPLGNYALDFTTGPDGVDLGNPPALQITGALTLMAWVYVDTIASNGRFIAKGGASGRRGWSLNLEGNNTWAFQIAGNSTTTIALNPPNVITGQWVHVAGVFDPTVPAMRFYVYGELVGERTDVPTTHFNSPANAWIGRRENGTEFDGQIDEVRVFNRALTAAEILALPEVAPTPVSLVLQPVSQTVAQFRNATFSAKAGGRPPHFYQWLENGVPIPGANSPTYTISNATVDLSGRAYSVTVSNLLTSITSSNAILTVSQDSTPPTLVSVGSVDGTTVGVCFSEQMDVFTASGFQNYSINDNSVAVFEAVLRPDGKTVLLTLAAPITGSFTVKVSGVLDLSFNEIAPESPASSIVAGLAPADLSSPVAAGSTFSCQGGDFDLIAGGDNIGGNADQGHVALKETLGDFDIKVRLLGLTAVDTLTEAGLMARETLDPSSPTLQVLANPPPPARGWVEPTRRVTPGGAAAVWGAPFTAAVTPNVWMRLRRAGDLFTGYYSVNGNDWVSLGTTTQVIPQTLLVGLAATAHNNLGAPTLAEFRGYGPMVFSNPTLTLTTAPADTTVAQNSTATFTAQAEGTGAPATELLYQWQRDDGAGGFTNILGANSPTLSVFAFPQDNGARFRVRAYLAGLIVTSPAATLTLISDVTRPTLVSVAAPGQGNQVIILYSEQVEQATATDVINYEIVNLSGGASPGILAGQLGPDGRTVTLTIDLLEENSMYQLTVNLVQDLAVPPNTIADDSTAQFQYNSLVGYWRFEEGAGTTTADSSGNGFTGTFVGDPVWVPSLFGTHALDFSNDRVDAGNPAALQITGPITVAAWVHIDSLTDNGRIVTKGGGPGQRGWSLNVEGNNTWAFQIAVTASVNLGVVVPEIPLGRWTHVAGVYDPSIPSMRLYTNGLLGAELLDGVPTAQHNSSLNVSIGARPVDQTYFDGRIDEVRVHARALSTAEIAQIGGPRFFPATISGGQIQLNWGGSGRLEWAPAVTGSWTPVEGTPVPPYAEAVVPGANRFFRLVSP